MLSPSKTRAGFRMVPGSCAEGLGDSPMAIRPTSARSIFRIGTSYLPPTHVQSGDQINGPVCGRVSQRLYDGHQPRRNENTKLKVYLVSNLEAVMMTIRWTLALILAITMAGPTGAEDKLRDE